MKKITKRASIFSAVFLFMVFLILGMVGWLRADQIKKEKSLIVRKMVPQITREIKIIAVKEKIDDSTKKHQKKNKKQPIQPDRPRAKKKSPRAKAADKAKSITKIPRQSAKPSKAAHTKERTALKLPYGNYQMNRRLSDIGLTLIDLKSSVPVVLASYDQVGFEAYLQKIGELGGRLFVGDPLEKKIIGEAILELFRGKYRCLGVNGIQNGALEGMALFRPREITGETLVWDILSNARHIDRHGDLRCVVLLPIEKEAAILGALYEYLKNNGFDISLFDRVWGLYVQRGNRFGLKVDRGRIRKTNQIVHLDMLLTM